MNRNMDNERNPLNINNCNARKAQKNANEIEERILSTGRERALILSFYEMLSPYILNLYKKEENLNIERLIAKCIVQESSKVEHQEVTVHSFYDSVKNKDGSFGHNTLERYEFLFRFTNVFSHSVRNALLAEIQSYRKDKGEVIYGQTNILNFPESLLFEFNLIQEIRKAYYREFKEYLSIFGLSKKMEIPNLASHFYEENNKLVERFDSHFMFRIELWCQRTFKDSLLEIQNKIDNWKVYTADNSPYFAQDTPRKKVAHDLMVIHYEATGKFITLKSMSKLLREKIGSEFPNRIFRSDRLNNPLSDRQLDLLKDFIDKTYAQSSPKFSIELINYLEFYQSTPRREYNPRFKNRSNFQWYIAPYQVKILTDITKGLDPFACKFYEHDDLMKSMLEGGIVRQHLAEDPEWDYIFHVYPDGDSYSYKIKLAPLLQYPSHSAIHSKEITRLGDLANDIVEARMRHLFELHQMRFESKLSKEYYVELFKEEFKDREDYIYQYGGGRDIKIWNEFENRKIPGITDEVIEILTEEWIEFKKDEKEWYNRRFNRFYNEKHLTFMNRVKEAREKGYHKFSKFYRELNKYLRGRLVP